MHDGIDYGNGEKSKTGRVEKRYDLI